MILEMILANKENTDELVQFAVIATTACIMAMALTGFSIKKLIQMMVSSA